jgi:hypothetical protein
MNVLKVAPCWRPFFVCVIYDFNLRLSLLNINNKQD